MVRAEMPGIVVWEGGVRMKTNCKSSKIPTKLKKNKNTHEATLTLFLCKKLAIFFLNKMFIEKNRKHPNNK